MLSKFLRPLNSLRPPILSLKNPGRATRPSGHYIPPTQYDVPIPWRLKLLHALRVHWEIIPLYLVVMSSLSIMTFSIFWATLHKVDVVYKTHSRENLSRTMDLRNPDVHKIFLINQRYDPWPEMQDVLDKMDVAQKTALSKARLCKPS